MSRNETLEAALALARAGERVLPLWWTDDKGVCLCSRDAACSSPGKHPLTAYGHKDASSDPQVIEGWFKDHPHANLGQRTDHVHRFDFDIPEVADALNSEASLAYSTVVVRTPRPGLHVSLLPPEPMKTRVLHLKDGRTLGELRGLDAYVVVPPSVIGCRQYESLSPEGVAPIRLEDPLGWLAGLLQEHGFELADGAQEKDYKRLGAGPILEGSRHDVLKSLTGLLYVAGVGEEVLLGMLDVVNQAQFDPPLLPDELRDLARHFVEQRKPREIHSAGTRETVPAERKYSPMVIRTAREIAEATPAEVAWVARPWIALGALTELDGKVKSSGKTTFLTRMVRCVLDGLPFMGQPTLKTPVVYLTEQGYSSLREALRRAGLLARDDLHVIAWQDVAGQPWDQVVAEVVEICMRLGASLLIVDTLSQFAGIDGEAENSSGAALEAMKPLQLAAARHNLGVIASRHERKSGGDVGDSGRGSSAFAGAADIVMSLRRPEGNANPTLRVIHAIGRYDETPDRLVIELTADGYKARGTEKALGIYRARAELEDKLPREGDGLTLEELMRATGLGRSSLQEALDAMCKEGSVVRSGKGVKGSALRYRLS